MGDYRIVVEGHGMHDNGRADDADNQAVRFRDALEMLGHKITLVGFSLRGESGLTPMRDLTHADLAHSGPERYSNSSTVRDGLDRPYEGAIDSTAADEGATDSIL